MSAKQPPRRPGPQRPGQVNYAANSARPAQNQGPARKPAGPAAHPRPAAVGPKKPAATWMRRIIPAWLCALALVALWWGSTHTRAGQYLDALTVPAEGHIPTSLWGFDYYCLTSITDKLVMASVFVPAIVAMLRTATFPDRLQWALRGSLIVVAANISTQLVKQVIFNRPDLGVGPFLENSLPSGHTTAAAAVTVATFVLLPHQLRTVGAVLGASLTAWFGWATINNGWHRLSDVVAALLVVAFWVFLLRPLGPEFCPPPGPGKAKAAPATRHLRRYKRVTAVLLLLSGLSLGALTYFAWPQQFVYTAAELYQAQHSYLGTVAALTALSTVVAGSCSLFCVRQQP